MKVDRLWIDYFRERDTTWTGIDKSELKLWIDYFRERDTTRVAERVKLESCGLITLGNEIQLQADDAFLSSCCGLITLGNEIQQGARHGSGSTSCGLITLGNEIQHECNA